jgi:hypothetical protein
MENRTFFCDRRISLIRPARSAVATLQRQQPMITGSRTLFLLYLITLTCTAEGKPPNNDDLTPVIA